MLKETDQSQHGGLPYEILMYILDCYVYQFDKTPNGGSSKYNLARSKPCQLLSMRLVCKIWSTAIIKMYFHTISLKSSKRAKIILDNWSHSIYGSILLSPVRKLHIVNLWYATTGLMGKCENDDHPVTMYQVVRVIERLGLNLKSLNLEFTLSMGVSPAMIKAVRPLKNLKELRITHDFGSTSSPGIYDPKSLANLITAIPQLESLSLLDQWRLNDIKLRPNALPNLNKFTFTLFPENIKGLAHICQTAKDSLKIIELHSEELIEDINDIFEPIKGTLEGCFTALFTDQIPTSVLMMEFPKLRVVGSFYLDEDGLDMAWLHWPMMRNVRTLVMFDTLTTAYWEEALELAGVKAFRTVPNLKHIIFVSQFDDDMSPELVKAFKTRGVHCHCVPSLPYDEIMELESKLNDPWNGPKTQSDCLPGGSYWTYRPLEL